MTVWLTQPPRLYIVQTRMHTDSLTTDCKLYMYVYTHTNAQEDLSSLKREIAILHRCRSDYVVEFKVRWTPVESCTLD